MDLFLATPRDIDEMMQQTDDIEIQRLLAQLSFAKVVEDALYEVEIVGKLSDLLVMQRGA